MRKGLLFGWYDPLHYGHVRLFRSARGHCDFLIVVVNEQGRKPELPLLPILKRVADLADLRTIDVVKARGARSREDWIQELQPDVLFVGPEDTRRQPAGLEVIVLPRTPGISSSALRAEIRRMRSSI